MKTEVWKVTLSRQPLCGTRACNVSRQPCRGLGITQRSKVGQRTARERRQRGFEALERDEERKWIQMFIQQCLWNALEWGLSHWPQKVASFKRKCSFNRHTVILNSSFFASLILLLFSVGLIGSKVKREVLYMGCRSGKNAAIVLSRYVCVWSKQRRVCVVRSSYRCFINNTIVLTASPLPLSFSLH